MSTESLPITPGAFAEAIKELPLAVLYSKVSELTNSITHLHRSNAELRAYLLESCDSEEEKKELESYVKENEDVAVSMNERIALLKTEVESRGLPWIELDQLKTDPNAPLTNGTGTGTGTGTGNGNGNGNGATGATQDATEGHGQGEGGEDGVYL